MTFLAMPFCLPLPNDPVPAHAGIAAVGAGEPAFGERVIALDVLAQGGHEELVAGRALVIAGLGIQNGRCADAGGRCQEASTTTATRAGTGSGRDEAIVTRAATATTVMPTVIMERAKRFLFS